MIMHVLIDIFAIIGAFSLACTIGLTIIWAISGFQIDQKITRPLPAEPMQATAEIRKVQ